MRLTLLRHAEAEDGPALRDIDRPLTAHGHLTARALGASLGRAGFAPDRVWVSPAIRATETVAGLARGLGREIRPRVRRDIYLASAADLLDLLQDDGDPGDLMMVGHNPGMQGLARALAEPGDPATGHLAHQDFAPCALLELSFAATSGRAIAPGTGRAERFMPPRAAADPPSSRT